jgi:hypothetical protein
MLLSLIQVRKQRVEFMLKFFCCAHAGSIAQRALCVICIFLRALSDPRRRLGRCHAFACQYIGDTAHYS